MDESFNEDHLAAVRRGDLAVELLDDLPVLALFIDRALTVRYASHLLPEVTGNGHGDAVGSKALNWIHPADRDAVARQLTGAMQGAGVIWPEVARYWGGDEWRMASTKASAASSAEWGSGVLVTVEDVIFDRPEDGFDDVRLFSWEGALVFAASGDVVVSGTYLRDALSCHRFVKVGALAAALGTLVDTDGVPIDAALPHSPIQRARRGDVLRGEVIGVDHKRTGERLWLELSTAPFSHRESGTVIVSVRCVNRERALLRHLAEAHLEADTAATDKALFLGWVAHEVRNPITAMVKLAESLERATPAVSEVQRVAAQIVENGHSAMRILAEVLENPPAQEELRPRVVLPRELAGDLLREFAHRVPPRTRLVNAVEDGLPPLDVDIAVLRAILTRLVENAIEYAPSGTVRIGSERCPDGQLGALFVDDTGPGIGSDRLATIFEPFGAREHHGDAPHRSGRGLGLWVARGLARRIGATLDVVTRRGQGSRFVVAWPSDPPSDGDSMSSAVG